jgi:hypothetical protein
MPSPLVLLSAAVVAFFAAVVWARGLIDADLYWHLATARLMVETGSIPQTDPFSFTYGGPWVTHEWLGQLMIHRLLESVGELPTAIVFGAITAAAPLTLAFALHRAGVRTGVLVALVAVSAYVMVSFATVRPQVISWLLLAILVVLLLHLRAEHRYRPWLVVPLFALWANLHGLYAVGLGVLVVHALFTVGGATSLAPRRVTAAGMTLAAFAASALTPAGVEGLAYPVRYLRPDDWGTAFIAEWQSPDLTDPRHWGLVLLIGATIVFGRGRAPAWVAVLALVGFAMALLATRNAPLAALLSFPMLALSLEDRLRPRRRPSSNPAARRAIETGVSAVLIVAIAVVVGGMQRGEDAVAASFPVDAVDELVVAQPEARLLVEYDWGGYAIHRLYDRGGRVFIDGRSDMYPRHIFEDYLALRQAQHGWEGLADAHRVEAILLPPGAPLVAATREAGWCEAHRDERAVLLLRNCP